MFFKKEKGKCAKQECNCRCRVRNDFSKRHYTLLIRKSSKNSQNNHSQNKHAAHNCHETKWFFQKLLCFHKFIISQKKRHCELEKVRHCETEKSRHCEPQAWQSTYKNACLHMDCHASLAMTWCGYFFAISATLVTTPARLCKSDGTIIFVA